jgi:endonuclease/exonuclease/phosphatase family metal-dependent hydrolase
MWHVRFIAVALLLVAQNAVAEECVKLQAFSNLGIPVHAGPGQVAVSHRLADKTVAEKLEVDEQTGWVRIKANAVDGWIIKRYISAVVPCPSDEQAAPVADEDAVPTYVIGCWNLEHFHDGARRGFPETPSKIPPRTESDYVAIAAMIERLELKIVVLSEINAAETRVVEGEGEEAEEFEDIRSPELERLMNILGAEFYDYTVGESGEAQRIAVLYDKRSAELNATWEMDLPNIRIQKKSICDRQPLVAHFTLLDGGQKKNDVAVVGVHLASGQANNKNHDKAMELVQENIAMARLEGWCIPKDENDVLIMGDFNASRFDRYKEKFWDEMEQSDWDVLADDDSYSPTRLSWPKDKPKLGLWVSRIDYVICTDGNGGLQGEEVGQPTADVHAELVEDADEFRSKASDHLPVTVRVKVMEDTDGRN